MAIADSLPRVAAGGDRLGNWVDRNAGRLMILPAVLILLAFALFPLIASAWLSLSRFRIVPGGFELRFIGLSNFRRLVLGSQQYHLLGTFGSFGPIDWLILAAGVALLGFGLYRYLTSRAVTVVGLVGRLVAGAVAFGILLLAVVTVASPGGFPGSLMTTLLYVFAGVAVQFLLGLGLALLCSRQIRGRNFFRVVFFIPLMVTPVGIAYTFRMLADMQKGPLAPLASLVGLGAFPWATDPWLARLIVMVGDTWQWTPFMFIVMLAIVESQPREQVEAALIDGAGPWQIFRHITWPAIAPAAATVVLIRLIEAFKIVDLPNVLTNGGPGIATESLTLHAFIAWRTQSLGESAAVGYALLFVAVVTCISFFNFVGRRARRFES